MKTKNSSRVLGSIAILFVLLLAGFLMTACNEAKPETDVTKLEGVIDQVGTSKSGDDLNNISVVFREEPSKISAKYNKAKIVFEKTTVEDYDGEGSGVTVYQYLYEFETPVDAGEYSENPIVVTCTIDGTEYQFDLTEDLADRIYGFI